jgi:perosamine synthetase
LIPISTVDLSLREKVYVKDAVGSEWISSTGKYVDWAEELLRTQYDCGFALTVCNGTAALHLALLGVGVKEGDEVICPDLAYIACANAIRYCGATPILVDVDRTGTINPNLIEDRITHRTRAILAVDSYGHSCNYLPLRKIADIHGLAIVEDAAEAHATFYDELPIGIFADVTTFSFYGNKCIVAGEGGAVLTNNEHLAKRMKLLRGQGMSEKRFVHPTLGYNYRMTNVQCAILCGQLERFEDIIEERQYVFDCYDESLAGIKGITLQYRAGWSTITPWLYSIFVGSEYGHSRDELMAHLKENGIETRPYFSPIHTMPPHMPDKYRTLSRIERRRYDVAHYNTSRRLSEEGMNLPTYNKLRKEDITRIADLIREYQSDD